MKLNNYSVLNAVKSLNFLVKIKNFMQKKATHLQKDVLNVVMLEKLETTAAAADQEAASVVKEKEENTL